MRVLGAVLVVVVVFVLSSVSAVAAPIAPVVAIKAPTGGSSTTVLLSGTVDPNGSLTTTGWDFQYSKDPVTEGWTPSSLTGTALVSGEVSGTLEGLQPNATYDVRLVASNGEGGEGVSAEPNPTFKTLSVPPTIVSVTAPAHPKATEARLEAIVNPNNELTEECKFEYGTTTSYGSELPCEPASLEGYGEQTVGVTLAGLVKGTTYDYRLVVKNATGTSETAGHFTTAIEPETPEALKGEPVGTGVKLEGVLNPKAPGDPGTYEFLYKQSATECTNSLATTTETATGAVGETAKSEVTGLLPNTEYTFCLRAHNEALEESQPSTTLTLRTLTAMPSVGAESFTNVGSSSATLHAQVDPGGTPTTYYFEYATQAEYLPTKSYSAKTPPQSAGAGAEPVSILANLKELVPDTRYHFRVVTNNTNGEAKGNDDSFSTFPQGLLGLPDDRGYEAVSPLDNGNATVLPGAPTRAAADGSAVAYVGTAPPIGGNGSTAGGAGIRPTGTNVYVAKHPTTSGWTTTDIEPPNIGSQETGFPTYEGFSSNLSIGFLSSPALSESEPAGQALYSHDNENGTYQLLAAGAQYGGSTPDGSHVLYSTSNGLYETAEGSSYLVSYLPNGTRYTPAGTEPAAKATFGSAEGDLEHAISNDGTRVFWTVAEPVLNGTGYNTKALYVRKNAMMPQSPIGPDGECTVPTDACTAQIDASQAPGNESGGGVFQTASTTGTKIFFTDCHRLTTNSTAVETPTCSTYDTENNDDKILPAGADLYEYNVEIGILTDLTSGTDTPGEHADVAGVLGASEDGTYIYFAAAGALTNGASPKLCEPLEQSEKAPTGTVVRKEVRNPAKDCNVYVIHAGERPQLVATLAQSDGFGGSGPTRIITFKEYGDWFPGRGSHLGLVSRDGRHLVFVSIENLTGFESEGNREIYMYDFGVGVSCVSCNPSGTPTVLESFSNETQIKTPAELPVSLSSTYALRALSAGGGRVFFESTEALVPGVPDVEAPGPHYPGAPEGKALDNVYEWERDGFGSCTRVGGCLFLLSGGTSNDLSFFVDASESGDDVFIGSRAQLVPEDHGEAYEVYDVRVGAASPPTPPTCTSTGCQGVPGAPPIFATPSSVTFNGIGNYPPPSSPVLVEPRPVKCKKGLVKKNGKCVRPKPKKKARVRKKAKGGKAKKSNRGKVSDRGVGARS